MLKAHNNFRRQGLSRRRRVEALNILPILSFHIPFPIAPSHSAASSSWERAPVVVPMTFNSGFHSWPYQAKTDHEVRRKLQRANTRRRTRSVIGSSVWKIPISCHRGPPSFGPTTRLGQPQSLRWKNPPLLFKVMSVSCFERLPIPSVTDA